MKKLIFKLFPTFYMWFLLKRHELLMKHDYDISDGLSGFDKIGMEGGKNERY